MSTAKAVTNLANKSGGRMQDTGLVDTFETWPRFSCCNVSELAKEVFGEGLGFEGSAALFNFVLQYSL